MNREKMTICRILLFAIASMPDFGKMSLTKWSSVKAV